VRFLLWFLRALFILLIVRMVLRLFFPPRPRQTSRGPARGRAGGGRTPEVVGGELVRDPQCGTYIPKTRALTVGSGEQILYFCSAACRDAYALAQRT
jgi:uncharacterized protein